LVLRVENPCDGVTEETSDKPQLLLGDRLVPTEVGFHNTAELINTRDNRCPALLPGVVRLTSARIWCNPIALLRRRLRWP